MSMHAPLFFCFDTPNRPKHTAKRHHVLELAAVESSRGNLPLVPDLEGSAQDWEPLYLKELWKAVYFHSSL